MLGRQGESYIMYKRLSPRDHKDTADMESRDYLDTLDMEENSGSSIYSVLTVPLLGFYQ